jgi:S-adenosylmethionine hydrolase
VILLFTDFGSEGPYLGQLEAVLLRAAPTVPVINLVSNAPAGDPLHASYLLAALAPRFPPGSVFLCVVDPGVGGDRHPVVLSADRRWFVGPDNGLLNVLALQATTTDWRIIRWRPERLSCSFHGRDLFAPIAARIASGDMNWEQECWTGPDLGPCRPDLPAVIYCDHYGNAMTGLRYAEAMKERALVVAGQSLHRARTFSAVPEGVAFWYENSIGLVEIAVNRGRADTLLGLAPGFPVALESVADRRQ